MTNADPLSDRLMMHLDATLLDIRMALNTITLDLRARDVPSPLVDDVNIVLCEVLTNIARHGYPNRTGWIECVVSTNKAGVACTILDSGILYNPHALGKQPPPQGLAEGGYGWALIHSLCDGLHYERRDDRNELSFLIPWRS